MSTAFLWPTSPAHCSRTSGHYRYLTDEESLRDTGWRSPALHHDSAGGRGRTSIHNGQYPSMHGGQPTPGVGEGQHRDGQSGSTRTRSHDDGNYSVGTGYDTYYKGKWHAPTPYPDPGTYNRVLTFNSKGELIRRRRTFYLAGDRLGPTGSAAIGPEPRKTNPAQSVPSPAVP